MERVCIYYLYVVCVCVRFHAQRVVFQTAIALASLFLCTVGHPLLCRRATSDTVALLLQRARMTFKTILFSVASIKLRSNGTVYKREYTRIGMHCDFQHRMQRECFQCPIQLIREYFVSTSILNTQCCCIFNSVDAQWFFT